MDAQVTIKLSTHELDAVRFALDSALKTNDENVKVMSPHDGRGLRAMQLRMKEIRDKL